MRSRIKASFQWTLFLSIFLHSAITLFTVFNAPKPVESNKKIEFELVEPKQNTEKKLQFVEQPETALNKELDESAQFMGRHNQVVKKQTRTKVQGESSKIETKKQLKVDDLIPKMKDFTDGLLAKQNQKIEQKEPQVQPKKQGGIVEYIKDLEEGLETALTTKEFIYYTYYARMRQQLNQHWTPKIKETIKQIYARGRQIASNQDKITRCIVYLDAAGKLIKIQIIGDSGVREIDEAATEALRAAAPFINPPRGMIDEDGIIRIRWDFILEA
jgi:TonB family protein